MCVCVFECFGESKKMSRNNIPDVTRFSLKSSLAASHNAGSVSSIFCSYFVMYILFFLYFTHEDRLTVHFSSNVFFFEILLLFEKRNFFE